MTLAELYRKLENHDWFHAMSDDPNVHESGKRSYIKLFYEARLIYDGVKLFNDYSKWVFSGPAFGTPKHPKPDMPKEQPVYMEKIEP